MANDEYKRIVFGSADNAVTSRIFGKHRKPFKKNGMTRKRANKLVDEATEMLINGTLPDTLYTEEMMERARSFTYW